MQTHKVMKYMLGDWRQVGVVELDDKGRSILNLSEVATGRLLLHPLTQIKEVVKPTAYTEPPWDPDNPFPFDDELKF